MQDTKLHSSSNKNQAEELALSLFLSILMTEGPRPDTMTPVISMFVCLVPSCSTQGRQSRPVPDVIHPSLLGLPHALDPSIYPYSMEVDKPCAHARCPKYCSCHFILSTSNSNLRFGWTSSRIDWSVRCSFQLTLNRLVNAHISNAVILFLSAASSVHVSQAYIATGQIKVSITLPLATSFQKHDSDPMVVAGYAQSHHGLFHHPFL